MKKKTSCKRPPPFSLWLSPQERHEIERRANNAGLSMGGYCKSVIFNTPPPRRSRRPSLDKVELSRLLGEVGRVGNNLNQVARQLNMYSAIDIVEVKDAIIGVTELRAGIMKALGYTEKLSDINPDKSERHHDH